MSRIAEHVAACRAEPGEELEEPELEEQRVRLHDRSWADYEALLAMRGDSAVPRITYLEGEIELMAPGIIHEDDKAKLARLLEAWADETGQFLDGFGSWTLKRKQVERGSEPDECYVVEARPRSRIRRPDIAIEVVRTSGGIPKLEVYRKLGVREVWFWSAGKLRFFVLRRSGRYTAVAQSTVLPALERTMLERAMREPNQPAAVRFLRSKLRRR